MGCGVLDSPVTSIPALESCSFPLPSMVLTPLPVCFRSDFYFSRHNSLLHSPWTHWARLSCVTDLCSEWISGRDYNTGVEMWFLQYLIDFVHPCLGDPYSYFFFFEELSFLFSRTPGLQPSLSQATRGNTKTLLLYWTAGFRSLCLNHSHLDFPLACFPHSGFPLACFPQDDFCRFPRTRNCLALSLFLE